MSTVLLLDTPERFNHALRFAADEILAGRPFAVPTETVYGLAANALNVDAVKRIFEIKARPQSNPLIVHVASLEMAQRYAKDWPAEAQRLASEFWPGPLTIVTRRDPLIPDIVTAGGDTVALRWPSHPFINALIDRVGVPLAAPSANTANSLSPTTAQHVLHSMGDKLNLIVDGGGCQIGIESTVVDVTQDPPKILRPGTLTSKTLGLPPYQHPTPQQARLSPGMGIRHYAPRANVVLIQSRQERDSWLANHLEEKTAWLFMTQSLGTVEGVIGRRLSQDPHEYARELYRILHELDDEGIRVVLVEHPPETEEWRGVIDRLSRASSHKSDNDGLHDKSHETG